jgi:hypothetical protein
VVFVPLSCNGFNADPTTCKINLSCIVLPSSQYAQSIAHITERETTIFQVKKKFSGNSVALAGLELAVQTKWNTNALSLHISIFTQ